MWFKKKRRCLPVGTPHQVPPTPSIIFSALLSSMRTFRKDKELKQVVSALKHAYYELERHDKAAADFFAAELYRQQMAMPFTRMQIGIASLVAVELGLATPTE
nr:MAG TPA: hypothetical protein [Caudoviricetes sp.]